jgi:chromatin segregation and condensation protein Rec8/ScpA/Scc1 (kleisin family)
MEDRLSLASDVRQSYGANAMEPTGCTLEKVVTISSHPAWCLAHDSAEEDAADSVDLVRVFHEVLERMRQAPVLRADDESLTTGRMIDKVSRRLMAEEAPLRLSQMLRIARTERAVICLQLALLELVRLQVVLLWHDRSVSDILLTRNAVLHHS